MPVSIPWYPVPTQYVVVSVHPYQYVASEATKPSQQVPFGLSRRRTQTCLPLRRRDEREASHREVQPLHKKATIARLTKVGNMSLCATLPNAALSCSGIAGSRHGRKASAVRRLAVDTRLPFLSTRASGGSALSRVRSPARSPLSDRRWRMTVRSAEVRNCKMLYAGAQVSWSPSLGLCSLGAARSATGSDKCPIPCSALMQESSSEVKDSSQMEVAAEVETE